ncbi:hypothetical protein P8C59_009177 [Phyllachora maydis]|uniref:Partial AB-hydrolase lipase domain-containing protein n=1 Tax=Phyllachora maydis TaxID=1825666 RepID=A0AAD9MFZ0_9PEZI|nr:hypothetical protein P8C59_009177 [Phyllachora maydis]
MPVPFLGRLNIAEYVALVGSFCLVGLEAMIRVLTLALPTTLLALLYRISRQLYNRWPRPQHKKASRKVATAIRNASDFVDLCALWGYKAEEHVVQTKDGYLLGLHRLAYRKGEEDDMVNSGPNSTAKRVVYLHHGLLMNSEVWVCLTDAHRTLPFVLVERGFDVWFGNNRGNKYSKKSVHTAPTSTAFWNFSIDEFAMHDIPDSIHYVLETTGQKSLSYIGFSQGTAQAFAGLSIFPKLNDKVNVFIALAPAMSPDGLHNGIVDALMKASPQVLFLLFGRRCILSAATMWQSILYPPLYSRVVDTGLVFLFNWKTANMRPLQKLAAYPHLYSFTSTKSVVHWFQIIRNKSFQMFDDDVHPPLSVSTRSKYTKVARYPTRNIRTPIVLVYGGADSLVDIHVMLRELPPQTVATEIPHYEHLDFLWAHDVDVQVFPHVFDALESFTGADHTKEEYARYRSARHASLSASTSFAHRPHEQDARGTSASASLADDSSDVDNSGLAGSNGDDATLVEDPEPYAEGGAGSSSASGTPRTPRGAGPGGTPRAQHVARESQIPTPSGGFARFAKARGGSLGGGRGGAPTPSSDGEESVVPTTPEGRRSVPAAGMDGAAEETARPEEQQPSPASAKRRSLGAGSSALSFDSMRSGKGISLGASRAVGGVTTSGAEAGPGRLHGT